MKIYKTTDYQMFKFFKGNRKLKEMHVRQLMESIKKRNILSQNPIIVNNLFFVLDGQHRLEAAKRLSIPIYYLTLEHGSLNDIWLLNTTQKNWSISDYVESYIEKGNNDYSILKQFSITHDLPWIISVCLLSSSFEGSMDIIKNGEFKVKCMATAERYVNCVNELRKHAHKGSGRSRYFLRAAIKLCKSEKISIKKLIKKIERRHLAIPKQATVEEYLRWYESIYNYRNNEPIRLF